MNILMNPNFGQGLSHDALADIPLPSRDAQAPMALLSRCPVAGQTSLQRADDLAAEAGCAEVWVKDESTRMGLGSFKALGAAYVIACDAEHGRAAGTTYVTASAGNHGLSVAAGADAFKAHSVIYLSNQVPEAFAERLRAIGAKVVRAGDTYEASMEAAQEAAKANGWRLLSDTSWPGYSDLPLRLMEGYLVMMAEAIAQIPTPPSHIFLQAGVGGLACACAALAREAWGKDPVVIVVEPEAAPALHGSIRAGGPQETPGPVSNMGRLDCKEPSLIALKGLAQDANAFALISEEEGEAGAAAAARAGMPSTPSGAAGLAALLQSAPHRDALGLSAQSRVLLILSEGPE